MKVLIITEGYFPGNNYGGPPVSINNLCRLLKDKADFFIITKDHDFKDRKRYDNITDGWNKSRELLNEVRRKMPEAWNLLITKIGGRHSPNSQRHHYYFTAIKWTL